MTRIKGRLGVWTACVVCLLTLTAIHGAYAGKGDTKAKGKQLYIWHFDEGTGKEAKESGGKGPTGKFSGDVAWTDGVSGKALQLAGAVGKAQYVELAGDDALDITDALTMAAWINLDAVPAGGQENKATIFFKNSYYLQVEPNTGSLAYYFYGAVPEGYHLSKNAVKADKNWWHVALTWDGSNATFYINGEPDPNVIKQSGPGTSRTDKALFLGGENNACCPRFFVGKMDDVSLANYALMKSELKDLMNMALPVQPRGKAATRWAELKITE